MIRYSIEAYDVNGNETDSDFAQTKREAITLAKRMIKESSSRKTSRIAIYPSKNYVVNYDHEVWGWKEGLNAS